MDIKFCFFLFVLFHSGSNSRMKRVIGGKKASQNQFPFSASLSFAKLHNHLCGATILNKYFAITAAHCLIK